MLQIITTKIIPDYESVVGLVAALAVALGFWKGYVVFVKERSLGRELAKALNKRLDEQELKIQKLELKNDSLERELQRAHSHNDFIEERQEKIMDLLFDKISL